MAEFFVKYRLVLINFLLLISILIVVFVPQENVNIKSLFTGIAIVIALINVRDSIYNIKQKNKEL
jgi:competence protein ComGC